MSKVQKEIVLKEVDVWLGLLRVKIHEQGYTQLEVQAKLKWGRSYISQLFRKDKSLRVDQVLLILEAIGVHPQDFFADLYLAHQVSRQQTDLEMFQERLQSEYQDGQCPLHPILIGLAQTLIDKDFVTAEEITKASSGLLTGFDQFTAH